MIPLTQQTLKEESKSELKEDEILKQKMLIHMLYIYDGARRVSGLRREPVVSVKNPTLIPTSH